MSHTFSFADYNKDLDSLKTKPIIVTVEKTAWVPLTSTFSITFIIVDPL